jgi:hypothetical protein
VKGNKARRGKIASVRGRALLREVHESGGLPPAHTTKYLTDFYFPSIFIFERNPMKQIHHEIYSNSNSLEYSRLWG